MPTGHQNVRICRGQGRALTAGLTQEVAVLGWPAANRQPRTLLAGVVEVPSQLISRERQVRGMKHICHEPTVGKVPSAGWHHGGK